MTTAVSSIVMVILITKQMCVFNEKRILTVSVCIAILKMLGISGVERSTAPINPCRQIDFEVTFLVMKYYLAKSTWHANQRNSV